MTAQVSDIFLFQESQYDIAGISKGELFDPLSLNLNPRSSCTACWRGFQAFYQIVDKELVLAYLGVNLFEGDTGYKQLQGPSINGVTPKCDNEISPFFNNLYDDLNYPIEYTGGLLIANGFIDELYVHMGFHPAWKYKKVFELIFDNGMLISDNDKSKKMADFRKLVLKRQKNQEKNAELSEEERKIFIKESFDLSY